MSLRNVHIGTGIILGLLLSPALAFSQKDAEGFELIKKEGRISIFERWLIFPGSNPPVEAREVKNEFFVRSNIYRILHILKDEKTIRVWQKHVRKFNVYTKPDTTYWQEYSYHTIPWPVSDQDHFLEYHVTEKKANQYLFIKFKSTKNETLAPIDEDVRRMEFVGSWELTQVSPSEVKVTYRVISMPIGIPRMFMDPIIRSNLMSTIKALTELAEENGLTVR